MLRVALTGGIGSGKSTVASLLAEMGAVVIDSDQLAREVLAPGSVGLEAVRERFGSEVIVDGALDRKALAAVVFADEAARRDLEAITHPLIRSRFESTLASLPADAIVINEVPLLVEANLQSEYDVVLTVVSSEAVKRERLVARGMSEREISERVNAQVSDEDRKAISDVVITNDGDIAALRSTLTTLWFERLKPYEEQRRLKARMGNPR